MIPYSPVGRRRLLVLALPLFAAACGPSVVQLREIGLARYLDRREIVRSSDGNRLELARNDWWGEPLGGLLARVLVVGLSQRLPQSNIYSEGSAISGDA